MSKSNRSTSDSHVSYPFEAAGRIKPLAEAGLGHAGDFHAVVIGRASATLPIDRVRYRGMHGLVRALS